jgi:hypothetical protein
LSVPHQEVWCQVACAIVPYIASVFSSAFDRWDIADSSGPACKAMIDSLKKHNDFLRTLANTCRPYLYLNSSTTMRMT